jgi:hypothetical protein
MGLSLAAVREVPGCKEIASPHRGILLLDALQNERLSGQNITTDHAKATTAINAAAIASGASALLRSA